MAFRDHRKKQRFPLWCSTTFFFLILFLLLIFSVFRESGIFGRVSLIDYNYSSSCDYSDGMWVHDPTIRFRYDQTCKEIFKGWNCISSNKSNARDLLLWRWKPKSCHLPHLDPLHFLNRFRHKSIGFVGDSLNRNMFVSLVCTLKRASSEVRKWRPVGADRGFTFLQYNLTIAYHRTNLLARYGRWSASSNEGALESLGYKQGFRVDIDVPEGSWANAPSFHDILIFNTGHWWWAPSKFDPVQSPMLFFENGLPILPPVSPELGLDMTLKHMSFPFSSVKTLVLQQVEILEFDGLIGKAAKATVMAEEMALN